MTCYGCEHHKNIIQFNGGRYAGVTDGCELGKESPLPDPCPDKDVPFSEPTKDIDLRRRFYPGERRTELIQYGPDAGTHEMQDECS